MKSYNYLFFVLIFGLVLLQAAPAYTQNQTELTHQEKMMALAKKFVDKVGTSMQIADMHLKGLDTEEIRLRPYFDTLAEGEPMVMIVRLGKKGHKDPKKITLDEPVTGIKRGYDVMISLTDFIYAANFPILVDGIAGTANGWFIRENQSFNLDVKSGRANVADKEYTLHPGEIEIDGEDILVKGSVLSQWFDFKLIIDPRGQHLKIDTAQLWPLQEQIDRQRRRESNTRRPPPKQPFKETEYKNFSIPSINVTSQNRLDRIPGIPTRRTRSTTVTAFGDLAKHAAKTTISGDDQEKLRNVTLNLSKKSEEADLLGPLEARFYEFNDISTVNVPFTGNAPQERGVRVTNKNPNVTFDTATQITGDARPGWDVELYNEDDFIDSLVAESNGTFTFNDVRLFAGKNEFRIIKYGPQGEIEQEERTFSVSPASFNGSGLYNASLSLQNLQTFREPESGDVDKGTPRISATYETQINDILSQQYGIKAFQEGGKYNAYLHNGLVAVMDNTIINADSVLSAQGPFALSLTERRNFGLHRTSVAARFNSEDYIPDKNSPDQTKPSILSLVGTARGPFLSTTRSDVNYDVTSSVGLNGDGRQTGNLRGNLSKRVGRTVYNSTTEYSTSRGGSATSTDFLDGSLSARGRHLQTTWRGTINYDVHPESQIREIKFDAKRNLQKDLEGTIDLQHNLVTELSSGELGLNWQTGRAVLSPTISYDSDDRLSMAMNVFFGISRNPYDGTIKMHETGLASSGGISAFVFLDKNGDNKFSDDDEPLPDASIEILQLNRFAQTNEEGEAFIYDLPTRVVTDVVVEENSGFDINWVSGFDGISVRPRTGHVTRVEFPIHRGGEIDGTVFVQFTPERKRPLNNLRLFLHDGDGRQIKTTITAFDGYYLLDRIPPGKYYLTIDQDSARRFQLERPLPKEFEFTYEGTVISDNDITLQPGRHDVPFVIGPDLTDWLAVNPTANIDGLDEMTVLLNLGHYNSRLLATLTWYKLKLMARNLVGDAEPIVLPSVSNRSIKTGKNILRVRVPGLTTKEAHRRCRLLQKEGFYCEVEFLPKGVSSMVKADIRSLKKG